MFFEESWGATYVPLRAIAETLNSKVSWDGDSKAITVQRNGRTAELTVGSDEVLVDGKPITLSAPVKLAGQSNRCMVDSLQMYCSYS